MFLFLFGLQQFDSPGHRCVYLLFQVLSDIDVTGLNRIPGGYIVGIFLHSGSWWIVVVVF